MTLPEWASKVGDDWRAPQAIIVKIDGVAQDLTDTDWVIASQMRLRSDDTTVVDFAYDTDTALLLAGKIVLLLDRADTEDEPPGGWIVDVTATNDTIAGVGRKTSATFAFTLKPRVTQIA